MVHPQAFSSINLDHLQGVLIDLDNTLYPYEPAHRAALRAVFADYAGPLSFDAFAAAYRDARTHVTQALQPGASCRSRFLAFQRMGETLGWTPIYTKALAFETLYWDRFIAAMRPDPAAIAFLTRCRDAALPVCLVTDMTAAIQARKIEALGLSSLIQHYVSSEEVGIEKPSAKIFSTALAKLGITPSQALMIGDDPTKDIRGAEALGIRAIRVLAEESHAV